MAVVVSDGVTNGSYITARAWVYFNASGGILRSYGVSSVSNWTTGNYQINFSSSLSANFSVMYTSDGSGAGSGNGVHSEVYPGYRAATYVGVSQYSWAGGWLNVPGNVIIFD